MTLNYTLMMLTVVAMMYVNVNLLTQSYMKVNTYLSVIKNLKYLNKMKHCTIHITLNKEA